MPRYFYTCESCQQESSFYHSMNDTKHDCHICNCTDVLKKKPSIFSLDNKQESKSETGAVVKKSIEDFQEELDCEKNKLKEKFYDPDE